MAKSGTSQFGVGGYLVSQTLGTYTTEVSTGLCYQNLSVIFCTGALGQGSEWPLTNQAKCTFLCPQLEKFFLIFFSL
jgi:hypothetical protein